MKQSPFVLGVPAVNGQCAPEGIHAAIVMDGNGRWATRRGLPRTAGHRAGASAVRRTVTAAANRGIGTLTLYAFSSDNWRRPAGEVRSLMRLFHSHLRSEGDRCEQEGVRVSVIGRRDRLGPDLLVAIESIERQTIGGTRLHLQIAVDYSARDAIVDAARLCNGSEAPLTRDVFAGLVSRTLHAGAPIPEVDLLVRTGGEQRLSDFMLWECAYAELVFTPCMWPDFGEEELDRALEEFRRRERRFGGIPPGSEVRPVSFATAGQRDREARVRG